MVPTRIAVPADATSISAVVAEALDGYRAWAPPDWIPPVPGSADVERLAAALGRDDVWCLLTLEQATIIGHVALSAETREDPEPTPPGTVNLWQLFVRPAWQGHGVATQLIDEAVAEAGRRGFTQMRLWTPQGAGRARRFYEREGWTLTGEVHDDSPLGLPTVAYRRTVDPIGAA